MASGYRAGMYQPAHGRFVVAQPAHLLAELTDDVPATIVSHGPDGFRTTILPMLFYPDEGEAGVLRGHVARGNPHWRELADSPAVIAIFNGPDAYVSPAWYEEKRLTGKVVPTWNYVTVVVHGTITLHPEPEWLLPHVRRLVDHHEGKRPEPWSIDDAPVAYVETQVKAIVGLELAISRIDAKRKLGQNRSAADIAGVIEALGEGTPGEQAVAAKMRR
jgi:transcriptional regulator